MSNLSRKQKITFLVLFILIGGTLAMWGGMRLETITMAGHGIMGWDAKYTPWWFDILDGLFQAYALLFIVVFVIWGVSKPGTWIRIKRPNKANVQNEREQGGDESTGVQD